MSSYIKGSQIIVNSNPLVVFAILLCPKSIEINLNLELPPYLHKISIWDKGYKVMSLASRRIHVTRDVVFHEDIFPFNSSTENNTFPSVLKSINTADCCDLNECTTLKHYSTMLNDHIDVIDNTTNMSSPYTSPQVPHHLSSPPAAPNLPVTALPGDAQKESHRESKIPHHLKDYIVSIHALKGPSSTTPPNCNPTSTITHNYSTNLSISALFSKHHHISPNVIAFTSQAMVENICHDSEPSSYDEVALNPAWQKAMIQEFDALYANNTWGSSYTTCR